MLKGIKLRLYPNRTQEHQLWQMFGNSRFVWNQMLAMANERYQNNPDSKYVGKYGMQSLLPTLKAEYSFLRESDATSLQLATHQLDQAFQMLFQHRGGHPKFRSRRKSVQSYNGTNSHSAVKVLAKRYLKLPKLGVIKTSKTGVLNDVQVKQYTVSHDATGRYYVAFQVEAAVAGLPKTGKRTGIDVGLADLAITSDGQKYGKFNAKWLDRQQRIWQRKYNRRKNHAEEDKERWNHDHKDTKMVLSDYANWQKAKQQRARYAARIKHQRKDYLHKLTTALVKQYDVIVIEDLRTKNLMHNHHLAAAIANASWYQFRSMLEYKCAWYGKQLIVVNPRNTSRICSACGHNDGPKPLEVREWTCPECGAYHDRDINAAVNILNAGLKAVG